MRTPDKPERGVQQTARTRRSKAALVMVVGSIRGIVPVADVHTGEDLTTVSAPALHLGGELVAAHARQTRTLRTI